MFCATENSWRGGLYVFESATSLVHPGFRRTSSVIGRLETAFAQSSIQAVATASALCDF